MHRVERPTTKRVKPPFQAPVLLALLALLVLPGAARAQWTTPDASGNINNTNPGNVRVGGAGAAPTAVVHARGNLSLPLTGTVAVTQNSATVTGSGTAFNTDFSVGDSIKVGSEVFTVSAIASATSLTLDSNYLGTTASGVTAYRDPNLLAVDNGDGVNKLTISRAGRVGIGTTAPSSRLSVIETATTSSRGIGITQYSTDATSALLNLTKLRGAPGAPTTVANGDSIGSIYANAFTGGYLATAGINFLINGTVTPSSAPTDMVFRTGTTGFGNENMRLTSNGNFGVGTTSPAYKLDVAGQVRSSSGGFVFPDGSVQATATNGTITGVTAGNGLTGGGVAGAVTLNIGAGTGLTVAPDSISVNYGSTAGTAVQGNTSVTVTAGSGMSGGGSVTLGAGGSVTLTNDDKGSAQNIFKSVANAAGAAQFAAGSNNDAIRFEGTGGTTVSFDAATKKVTINSSTSSATLSAANVSAGQFGSSTGGGDYSFPGNVTVAGNIAAKYQDVAEWVPSEQKLQAGTVVVIDTERSNHVLASTSSYDTKVAGVISAQPGISLGERGEGKLLVATTGRVRVKVDATKGPIKVGDLLVTSEVEGMAMKSEPIIMSGRKIHSPGTIIGKALEPLAGGVSEILVLLSLQ